MLFQRLIPYLFLVLLCFQVSSSAIAGGKATCDKYFSAVLDLALSSKMNTKEYPQTLDALNNLSKKGKNVNECLVTLLDYYIGEGAGEVLSEYITEKGKVMLPILSEKKMKPLECLPKYKSICSDRETRDENIDMLINAIKEGKVLGTEE